MSKWTVMIYMAGDNNLDSNGIQDLLEMKRVGSTDEVTIAAQFDRSGPTLHTKRYVLQNFGKNPHLRDDEVDDLGETNSGDKDEFIRFLEWGLGFGAEKNLVVIWGHGTGTDDTNIYVNNRFLSTPAVRRRGIFRPRPPSAARNLVNTFNLDISNNRFLLGLSDRTYEIVATDDEAEDFLDNVELKQAFNSISRPIDIVGMDACLMSMAEICYQLRENVGISVASQAQTERDGWPYERIFKKLVANPNMTPEQLSGVIVSEFIDFYNEHTGVSAALTACRLKAAPDLAGLVDNLADTLIARLSSTSILNAIMASRRLVWADEIIETVDLEDLCGLLKKNCNDTAIDGACTDVINFIQNHNNIVIDFAKHGSKVRFANGLGIYFPQDEVSSSYGRLDFVNRGPAPSAPKWATFITKYVAAITR